jgi:hypothetical protein
MVERHDHGIVGGPAAGDAGIRLADVGEHIRLAGFTTDLRLLDK